MQETGTSTKRSERTRKKQAHVQKELMELRERQQRWKKEGKRENGNKDAHFLLRVL